MRMNFSIVRMGTKNDVDMSAPKNNTRTLGPPNI